MRPRPTVFMLWPDTSCLFPFFFVVKESGSRRGLRRGREQPGLAGEAGAAGARERYAGQGQGSRGGEHRTQLAQEDGCVVVWCGTVRCAVLCCAVAWCVCLFFCMDGWMDGGERMHRLLVFFRLRHRIEHDL